MPLTKGRPVPRQSGWKLMACALYPEQQAKITRVAKSLARPSGSKPNQSLAIRWLITHAPEPE